MSLPLPTSLRMLVKVSSVRSPCMMFSRAMPVLFRDRRRQPVDLTPVMFAAPPVVLIACATSCCNTCAWRATSIEDLKNAPIFLDSKNTRRGLPKARSGPTSDSSEERAEPGPGLAAGDLTRCRRLGHDLTDRAAHRRHDRDVTGGNLAHQSLAPVIAAGAAYTTARLLQTWQPQPQHVQPARLASASLEASVLRLGKRAFSATCRDAISVAALCAGLGAKRSQRRHAGGSSPSLNAAIAALTAFMAMTASSSMPVVISSSGAIRRPRREDLVGCRLGRRRIVSQARMSLSTSLGAPHQRSQCVRRHARR